MNYSDMLLPTVKGKFKRNHKSGLPSLRLLDIDSDDELGELCALATYICPLANVNICLFEVYPGMIKKKYNLGLSECPKSLKTFNRLVLQNDDILVVPDSYKDSRFLSLGKKREEIAFRFLISLSLKDRDGKRLGALVLTDPEPGLVSSTQKKAIQTVARQVENLLELRETNYDFTHQKEQFQRIVEHSPNIVYRFSQIPGESYHSPRTEEILGYSTQQLQENPDLWRNSIHPGDLEKVDRAVAETKQGTPIDLTYRIRTKGGQWRWLHDRTVNIIDDQENIYIEGVASDVTIQKQNEEKLLTQAGYIESLLSAIPDLLFLISKEGEYLEVKAGNREDLLKPKELLLGKNLKDILSQELGGRFMTAISETITEQTVRTLDYELVIGDRKKIFESRFAPFGSEKVVVLTRNVTDERAMLEKLRISEEAFRGSFENAAVGMAIVGTEGEWLKVNKALLDKFGYDEQELLQLTFQDVTHPADLDKDLNLLEKIKKGSINKYKMEKRYLHKDGSVIHTILAVSTVKDSGGEILYFISQIVDVTSLKQAEMKLASALLKNQAILDASVNTAIIGTDLNGTIHTFNTGAELLTGYTANDVVNECTSQLFHLEEEIENVRDDYRQEFDNDPDGFDLFTLKAQRGETDIREWTYVRKDKTQVPVQVSVSLIKGNREETTGYLLMATDISSMKKAEYELKLLVDLTQTQNDRLKNFAGIVSHNLRNHAGNIDGVINLLEEELPETSTSEYFPHLKQASDNLINTIKNLSDITHLNDVDESKMETINLNEYIDKAIQNVSASTKKEGVAIIHQNKHEELIYGVPAYLDSVVLNFITNGIKYRSDKRESFIKLTISHSDGYTVLCVEDNGQGIDLEKHGDELFGQYNTFHDHPDSRGIGLFITKNQVNAMGGKIEVDSEPGAGTTFRIYFKRYSDLNRDQIGD